MEASTQPRNSSPKPIRRSSYQAYASARSFSTSGARMSSAAMTTANPTFDLLPRQSSGGVVCQGSLPPGQLLLLPVVNRYRFGGGRQVIPQVFDKLKLFRRAQIKDRRADRIHLHSSANTI